MTSKEQTNLLHIAKMRERTTKSSLEEVGANLLVDLDRQLDTYYAFSSDEIWKEAHRIADEACKEAQAKVVARNRELGIPERFAPSLECQWYSAGEQAAKKRRDELRKVGQRQVEAMIRTGKRKIEESSCDIQTQIMASSFSSEAQNLLDTMPTPEQLMPKLNLGALESMLGNGSDYRHRLE